MAKIREEQQKSTKLIRVNKSRKSERFVRALNIEKLQQESCALKRQLLCRFPACPLMSPIPYNSASCPLESSSSLPSPPDNQPKFILPSSQVAKVVGIYPKNVAKKTIKKHDDNFPCLHFFYSFVCCLGLK
jgi:hypothetical protein